MRIALRFRLGFCEIDARHGQRCAAHREAKKATTYRLPARRKLGRRRQPTGCRDHGNEQQRRVVNFEFDVEVGISAQRYVIRRDNSQSRGGYISVSKPLAA